MSKRIVTSAEIREGLAILAQVHEVDPHPTDFLWLDRLEKELAIAEARERGTRDERFKKYL